MEQRPISTVFHVAEKQPITMKKTGAKQGRSGKRPNAATAMDAGDPVADEGEVKSRTPSEASANRTDAVQVAESATDEPSVAGEDLVAVLRDKVAGLEDSLLRAKADYQNLQRRSAVERSEALRYANAELMKALVVVLDDFERSLQAAGDSNRRDAIMEGVQLVYQNLVKALNEHGLEAIQAGGMPFDPEVHEALMSQPSKDATPGTVLEEVAKGYRLRDRVIRPAKVIVAQAPQAERHLPGDKDQGEPKREQKCTGENTGDADVRV